MQPTFKRYRDIAIVALLLTVPFFFLRTNMKRKDGVENRSALDRAILRISAPIEYGAASMARGVSGIWGDYVYLVDVKADNDRLAYDNARLREEVRRLEGERVDNQQLRRLLQLREATPGETVSAMVVGKEMTPFFRVSRVVLDRRSHEIRAHMPVISPDGVVGAVVGVAGDSVDVQLAVDAQFGVDVEDVRTGAGGFVRGTSDPSKYTCKVEMVDARDEIEAGDLLVTSGKGKWFPKGIPVAKVTSVKKREVGRDQDVAAEPTVNFSRLDSVLILATPLADDTNPAPTALAPTQAQKGR